MNTNIKSINMKSPSRLHFTLIDMNGKYSGRVDGGVGLAIKDPFTSIVVHPRSDNIIFINQKTDDDQLYPELITEITSAVKQIQCNYSLKGVSIDIEKTIPAHSGFGSKTQTLLSASVAYCRMYGVTTIVRDICKLIGRGGTSGIGVEVFNSGGFVVDCGHPFYLKNYTFRPSSASKSLPPATLLGQYKFPDWPILIVTPRGRHIYGAEEQRLFDAICPIPLTDVQTCTHVVLMMLIPAVIEGDLETFCKGIDALQALAWKQFEIESQDAVVIKIMKELKNLEINGIGMSSWGPTIFAFGLPLIRGEPHDLLRQVRSLLDINGGGDCFVTQAQNGGAMIKEVT